MLNKYLLYFNTIKYMPLSQILATCMRPYLQKRAYRLKKKDSIRIKDNVRCVDICIPELDNSADIISKFNYKDIENNIFTFLYDSYEVNLDKWNVNASPLWVFNLHYFEYAVYLGAMFKETGEDRYFQKFKEIIEKWIETNSSNSIAWHPYPISLRIINLLIALQLFEEKSNQEKVFYDAILNSIYRQYRTLILRKELWLSGNHYFENLFTIVVASFFFREDDILKKYLNRFKEEVFKQILPDGMHYELSPMYHKVILVDMLRFKQLSEHSDFPDCPWIDDVLSRMLHALKCLSCGSERTALFNDSGNNVAKSDANIEEAAERLGISCKKERGQLPDAGYYRIDGERNSILIDAGKIGPSEMPGHGHCDCLSFELLRDGKVIFTNSGTFQYQGDKRSYFRSTRAHNTITIDGNEQSQCWREHRVARRIRDVKGEIDKNRFCGQYKNYLGQKHTREMFFTDKELKVLDQVENGKHINSYLHVSSLYKVGDDMMIYDNDDIIAEVQAIGCVAKVLRTGELCQQSIDFGKLENGTCIMFEWDVDSIEKRGYRIIFKEN